MFKRNITTALVFGAAALAPPVYAQDKIACLHRDKMVQLLETRFDESLKSIGLQGQTQLLEIWSSDNSGSFTVLITNAEGTSCVVASGQNWQTINAQAAKAGTAS